jgi:Uma2 family endonuclease
MEHLPDDGHRYDLIRGELHRMSPTGPRHGRLANRLARAIDNFVVEHDLGEGFIAEPGFILARDPDVLVSPDYAFVSWERLPPDDELIRFSAFAPDLVVEVMSPSDRPDPVDAKVAEYVRAGVRLVLVFDPDARTVSAHGPDIESRTYTEADVLEGGSVLPGFRLHIAELFKTRR